jgi:hypothetical protein
MRGLLLACLIGGVTQAPSGMDPQGLIGSWRGEGRYVDTESDREHGPILFLFRVDASLRGEGKVGEARIREWRLEKAGRWIRIEAHLEGRIRLDAPSDKDHLLLVVEELGENQFVASFKLTCHESFDPAPAEGRAAFMRLRPLREAERPGSPATGPSRP